VPRYPAADVWIFGYGSLIFRPDFPFVEQRAGLLRGYARRFWQASMDHRGTPEAPGRVVTLIESAGESCSGMAYRVAAADREPVLALLDHRERGGYARRSLRLSTHAGTLEDVVVYVADETNPNYVGPEELERIVSIVGAARGPSGANREYVLRLAEALERMGAEDAHVFEIARAVLASRQ
jgi:cation transport protein ChaC